MDTRLKRIQTALIGLGHSEAEANEIIEIVTDMKVEAAFPRFKAVSSSDDPNDWIVKDQMSNSFDMNRQAVTLHMRREAANTVAEIMNLEWDAFQRNPS